MKAFLMHEDSDFRVELPANADDLIADLELEVLFTAMAGGDPFLFEVAKCAVLSTLTDAGSISYRQTMLRDCIANPALIRELYTLAVDALDAQRKVFGSLFRDSPKAIVSWSVEVLGVLADFMARLRALADEHGSEAGAPGFKRFFAMLSEQLDDQYMATVRTQLDELRFGRGMLISAELGPGNRGAGYVLRRGRRLGRLQRLLDRSGHTFTVPDRDESGFRALRQLEDRGLARVANAVAQATDHVLSFFKMLRIETGYYVACLNLLDRLNELGEPTCFPIRGNTSGARAVGRRPVRPVPRADRRPAGCRQSARRRRQDVDLHHRREPGGEIDLPACGRTRAADARRRDVRRRRVVQRRSPRRPVHALQTRGGRGARKRQARRGAAQNERDRRRDRAGLDAALQRVVLVDQRTRGRRDRPSGRSGDDRRRRQGAVRHPPVRTCGRLPRRGPARGAVSACGARRRPAAHVRADRGRAADDLVWRRLVRAGVRRAARGGRTRCGVSRPRSARWACSYWRYRWRCSPR